MQPRWYTGATRGQWLALVAALLGWAFDGFEQGVFPLAARPALIELLSLQEPARVLKEAPSDSPEWKAAKAAVDEPVRRWNAVVNAAFLFGAAAGGVFFGWLGDRIGRVRAMVFSVLTYALCTGLGGLAATAGQLAVLRFAASLGMGGEWALGVALVMESWPSHSRPVLAGMIGAAANVGFVAVSLLTLTLQPDVVWHVPAFLGVLPGATAGLGGTQLGAWRPLLAVCVVPALLTYLLRTFVPESKQWETAVASGPRARVRDIFVPALRRRSLLGAGIGAVALLATWGGVQQVPLWVPSLSGAPGKAPTYASLCMALGATTGAFLGALVGQRFSRRAMYFALCLSSLVVCEMLFLGSWSFGPGLLGMLFLVGTASAAFYGWLPLYLPELFPTRVRATGQGFAYNCGRVLAGIGTLMMLSIDLKGHFAEAGAIIVLIYLVGLVLAWFIPETRNAALPE